MDSNFLGPFSCSPGELSEVLSALGDLAAAQTACSRYNVTDIGAMKAAMRYLASPSLGVAEANYSLNVMFLLSSSYLVFIMQAGFALVSRKGAPSSTRM